MLAIKRNQQTATVTFAMASRPEYDKEGNHVVVRGDPSDTFNLHIFCPPKDRGFDYKPFKVSDADEFDDIRKTAVGLMEQKAEAADTSHVALPNFTREWWNEIFDSAVTDFEDYPREFLLSCNKLKTCAVRLALMNPITFGDLYRNDPDNTTRAVLVASPETTMWAGAIDLMGPLWATDFATMAQRQATTDAPRTQPQATSSTQPVLKEYHLVKPNREPTKDWKGIEKSLGKEAMEKYLLFDPEGNPDDMELSRSLHQTMEGIYGSPSMILYRNIFVDAWGATPKWKGPKLQLAKDLSVRLALTPPSVFKKSYCSGPDSASNGKLGKSIYTLQWMGAHQAYGAPYNHCGIKLLRQPNEVTKARQPNEVTEASQSNEVTEASQSNEVTKTSQPNGATEARLPVGSFPKELVRLSMLDTSKVLGTRYIDVPFAQHITLCWSRALAWKDSPESNFKGYSTDKLEFQEDMQNMKTVSNSMHAIAVRLEKDMKDTGSDFSEVYRRIFMAVFMDKLVDPVSGWQIPRDFDKDDTINFVRSVAVLFACTPPWNFRYEFTKGSVETSNAQQVTVGHLRPSPRTYQWSGARLAFGSPWNLDKREIDAHSGVLWFTLPFDRFDSSLWDNATANWEDHHQCTLKPYAVSDILSQYQKVRAIVQQTAKAKSYKSDFFSLKTWFYILEDAFKDTEKREFISTDDDAKLIREVTCRVALSPPADLVALGAHFFVAQELAHIGAVAKLPVPFWLVASALLGNPWFSWDDSQFDDESNGEEQRQREEHEFPDPDDSSAEDDDLPSAVVVGNTGNGEDADADADAVADKEKEDGEAGGNGTADPKEGFLDTSGLDSLGKAAAKVQESSQGEEASPPKSPASVLAQLSQASQMELATLARVYLPDSSDFLKVLVAGIIGAKLLKKPLLTFLLPVSTDDALKWQGSDRTNKFPEVESCKGNVGIALKAGYEELQANQKKEAELAMKGLGLVRVKLDTLPSHKTFLLFLKRCRQVFMDYRHMHPHLSGDSLKNLIQEELWAQNTKTKFEKKMAEVKKKFYKTLFERKKREEEREEDDMEEDEMDEDDIKDVHPEKSGHKRTLPSRKRASPVSYQPKVNMNTPRKKAKKRATPNSAIKREQVSHTPFDWKTVAAPQRAPVRKVSMTGGTDEVVQYSKPGKSWVKDQNRKIGLLMRLLIILQTEDDIVPPFKEWRAQVDDLIGGSSNGADPNIRAFICLVSSCLFMTMTESAGDELVMTILAKLHEENLLSREALAQSTKRKVTTIIQQIVPGGKFTADWLVPLAKELKNKDLPSSRSGVLDLKSLDGVVTDPIVNMYLSEAFNFMPGLVLDRDCRKLVCAFQMIDIYEFMDARRHTIKFDRIPLGHIEQSLMTWIPRLDWASFHDTLKGIIQVMAFKQKKNEKKTKNRVALVETRINQHFIDADGEELMGMMSTIVSHYTGIKMAT